MKKVLNIALLASLLISSALADEDLLAKVTNGALSDKSKGVKVLSLDEMKEVKGGAISQDARIAPIVAWGLRQGVMWGIRYTAWGAYNQHHPLNSSAGIHGWYW